MSLLNHKNRRGVVVHKRKPIRWNDPITINMIGGPDAATGDKRRVIMKRLFKIKRIRGIITATKIHIT